MNIDKTDISLAPFNASDVRTIEAAGHGEGFLRKFPLGSQLAHTATEGQSSSVALCLGHATIRTSVMTLSLRTMSIYIRPLGVPRALTEATHKQPWPWQETLSCP